MEIIKLNLIPNGVNPTCHAKQYDEGRVIRFELFEGLTPYTLQSGDTVTLNLRKPDNTIISASITATQGNNYVDLVTTEQMCACVGYNLGTFKLTNGSVDIGTLNFIMAIERDVLADGIPSQSVIEDLDERIAEAIGDDYYNKTETDDLLDAKADKSTTYTKTQVDSALALKANSSDVYTKTETDALLALKADKSEVYNVYPTEQESGDIASFTDGADNIPVKSLVSQIVAVESGNGQPKSPSNPYTISGFNNGVVSVCGKNLFNPTNYSSYLQANGTYRADVTPINTIRNYIGKGLIGKEVTFSVYIDNSLEVSQPTNVSVRANVNGVNVNGNAIAQNAKGYSKVTFTPQSDNDYVYITYGSGGGRYITFYDLLLELGNERTTYEAYNGNDYTFTFGQTIYGGYFDNKGNLVVTHGYIEFDGSNDENWVKSNVYAWNVYIPLPLAKKPQYAGNSNAICNLCEFSPNNGAYEHFCNVSDSGNLNVGLLADANVTTAEEWKTYLSNSPLQVVYELANPIVIPISSQDIPSILGENNIFSNTGDVDVTIRADIGLYIDKRLNTTRSTPTLSLSKGSLKVEAPVSNEEPAIEEDPVEESEDNNEER